MSDYPEDTAPGNDPPAAPTVAKAILMIATWDDLSTERRRGLTSSLRAIARIAETDPAMLHLCPAELNAKVLAKAPQLFGLSATSMSTVRSHVRYISRRLGQLDSLRAPLSPAWAQLRKSMPRRTSVTLTRFIEYHSGVAISPTAVSDATFAACQVWVQAATLCRTPARLFAQMRYRWNKAARELPDLGLPLLCAARRQTRKTVALEDMHPGLQADLARMAARLGSSDLDDAFHDDDYFADVPTTDVGARPGPRRALKPITIMERMRHIRQAVWVTVQIGVPLDEIHSLRNLVVPLDCAKQIVRFMWNRAGKAPSAQAGHVAEGLRQVAKYHVGLPKEDADKIAGWQRQAAVKYTEMTEKNRRRLEALLTSEVEAKILALPRVLMAEARDLLPVSPMLAVSAAKRALLLHIELFYPFRVRNVCQLRRDRHFIPAVPGSKDVARFLIPGEEVKNGQTIDRQVLSLTNDYIREWENTFRPLFSAPGNPFLFPGQDDRPMCRQAIAATLKKIILERVGCEINIHLMRHRAAVTYLKMHPGEFEIIAQILGHKTAATARKSYTGPERDAAFDRFDESVLETMKSLKHKSPPKHRGVGPKTRTRHATGTATPGTRRHTTAKTTPSPSPLSMAPPGTNLSATGKPGAISRPSQNEGSGE